MDQPKRNSYAWVYAVGLVFSLVLMGLGIYLASTRGVWSVLAAGCASIVAVLITWPLSQQLGAFRGAISAQAERALNSIDERFKEFSIMLNLISEQQLLSDRAKAVAFREKDSDALRRAIQDEMQKQNWEVARSLANEMETAFGYKREADHLRTEIDSRHQDVIRKQIGESMALIERHARGEAWTEAMQEAQRVAKAFPDNVQAANLPSDVEKRRETHKQQLIGNWNDAVNRHDVDAAIEIIKKLDAYLTPTEAEAYQESARSVFHQMIRNLRTQFSVAVRDHRWADALRLADKIVADFPHSHVAKEVRDMMDSLRARASGLEPAQV